MMEKKSIAIITARGGSKRIPGKNKKEFCGKPIICYSIEAALTSGIFEEIIVSTDDEEIAAIAVKAGASVPFMRSEKTANDFATTDDVLLEVLEEYEKRGVTFSYMACLYPTAPFLTGQRLKEAMELMIDGEGAGIMPVTAFSFPPQRGMFIREGRLSYCQPEYETARSQDLEKMYHDCGQFYCYNVKKYRACRGQLTEGYLPILIPEDQVQDIDNPEDWRLAEMKYRIMREEGGR